MNYILDYETFRDTGLGPPSYSPLQFGAYCDGIHDDSPAIIKAINAAGNGGIITLGGSGTWLWLPSNPLTLLPYQRLSGLSQSYGQGSNSVPCQLSMPNIANGNPGIVAGAGGTGLIEYLFIRGSGASNGAIGLTNGGALNSTLKVRACHFYDWGIGCQLSASYYSSFTEVEFRHNDIGLDLVSNCYNLSLFDPRFDGSNPFSTYGTCIRTDAIESMSIFGGSIESYGGRLDSIPHAGILVTNTTIRSDINLYGTYWETGINGGTGINVSGTPAAVKILGAQVALGNHLEWYNGTSAVAGGLLYSRGVTFFGSSSLTTTPMGYRFDNLPNITIDIDDDMWQVSGVSGATYANGQDSTSNPNVNAAMPLSYNGSGSTNKIYRYFGRGLSIPSSNTIRTGRGITGSRPSASVVGIGATWFDTTLNKPIWSDGSVWRDATGTAV